MKLNRAQNSSGKDTVDLETEITFQKSGLVCLDHNQPSKVFLKFPSENVSKISLNINYDSGSMNSEKSVSKNISDLKSNMNLCFLYEYYSSSEEPKETTANMYIKFLTKGQSFIPEEILRLSQQSESESLSYLKSNSQILTKIYSNNSLLYSFLSENKSKKKVSFALDNTKLFMKRGLCILPYSKKLNNKFRLCSSKLISHIPMS